MYNLTSDYHYKSNIVLHSQSKYNEDVFVFEFDKNSQSIYYVGDHYQANNCIGSVFIDKITNRGFSFYTYIQSQKVSFFIAHSKITSYGK
jgi:hypothetical protein